MTNDKEDKRELILKWLKEFERLPTSRIMALIGCNLEYTLKYLEELESEKLIKKQEETNATYWELKEKKK